MSQQRTDPGNKSAAELEREVEAQRAQVEDTLDSLQERLSPGQMMDQLFDYAKNGNGAEFTRNLGRSVRDNPLPVALMGVGIAWLMLGGANGGSARSRYRDDDRYLDDWDDDDWDDRFAADEYDISSRPVSFGTTSQARGGSAGTYGDTTDSGKTMSEKAGDATEGVKDRLGAAGAALRDKGERAGAAIRGTGERAGAALRDTGDAASRYGRGFRRRARHYGDQASESAGRYGRRARRSFLDTLEEQPLVLGAIGIAIGAALGAALPPTEREDELMGESRDELKHRAETVAREQGEKAREVANAAYGAAKEETGSSLDASKKKAADIADAAKTAAQREASKS
jgi:hypothetical protein